MVKGRDLGEGGFVLKICWFGIFSMATSESQYSIFFFLESWMAKMGQLEKTGFCLKVYTSFTSMIKGGISSVPRIIRRYFCGSARSVFILREPVEDQVTGYGTIYFNRSINLLYRYFILDFTSKKIVHAIVMSVNDWYPHQD